jgi:hypothetical protein
MLSGYTAHAVSSRSRPDTARLGEADKTLGEKQKNGFIVRTQQSVINKQ